MVSLGVERSNATLFAMLVLRGIIDSRYIQNLRGEKMASTQKRLHIPAAGGFGSLPFSSGVLVDKTFYICGHLGLDPVTKKVPDSVEREIRLMMDSLRDTLVKVEMTMQDLVSVQIFCPDVSLFAQFNEIYRTYFAEPLPARAFIGSGPLLFGARFEIQGIAVKD
jgi:2-iminobutanoate/2-iminopropanoate deaminase